MGCFKVAQFHSLFNVIKTKLLSVIPTVTKDGRGRVGREGEAEAGGGEEKTLENSWVTMRESVWI